MRRSASRSNRIPTSPGNKLEAYCSGLGKVLLADLPACDRDQYLADGPFPPLTARTIVQPEALDRELAAIRERVKKYADISPAFETAAKRREAKAKAAEDAGVPVVEVTETVPPGQDSFVAWQDGQLEALAKALGVTT